MKNFYRELIKMCKDAKWLAKEMKVSQQTIYAWKSRKTKPKISNIGRLAKILKMDVDAIIDDFHL